MTPYGVREIARVAHPCSARLKYLVMLIAYFDESGDPHDTPAFTLAGWVASEKQWRKFECKWLCILRRYDLYREVNGERQYYFHMSDFESRKPPFDKLDSTDRIACLAQLAAIIKNTVVAGVSHSMNVQAYNEIIKSQLDIPREIQRGHYAFLLQSCMEWLTENVALPRDERMAVVCDRKDWVRALATEHYFKLLDTHGWGNFFGSLTFEDKMRFPPLQAADMLAFEGFKERHKTLTAPQRARRRLLENLSSSKKLSLAYYDDEGFRAFLAQVPLGKG